MTNTESKPTVAARLIAAARQALSAQYIDGLSDDTRELQSMLDNAVAPDASRNEGLVERLRDAADHQPDHWIWLSDAADALEAKDAEIEGLKVCNAVLRDQELKARCRIAKLEAALQTIHAENDEHVCGPDGCFAHRVEEITSAALKDDKGE